MLLADVFEQFRDKCYEVYGLDAAHYYTSPGLAWDAALKYTEVKLDSIADIDKHLFLERGMRGGIAMITHRHAKANNSSLPDYHFSQLTSFIMFLDANNLYGWAMSQSLPVREFEWVPEEDLMGLNITQVADDASEGYILEVYLEYPKELHDLHNDYPLASENVFITPDMLSSYSRHLAEDLEYKPAEVRKLLPNLYDKKNYIIHYRNLKFYLDKGMKLIKIHRVLKFKKEAWLKPYIDLNTSKRSMASNALEKDFSS